MASKFRSHRKRRFHKRMKHYRKYYKKDALGSKEVMVNRVSANFHTPYAPRYMTKFYLERTFKLALGSDAFGISAVKLNSMFKPFTNVSLGAVIGGGTKDDFPSGYSNLLNANAYQRFRVYGAKLTVTFIPMSVLDAMVVAVAPLPSGDSVPTDFSTIERMSYSKTRVVTCNNNQKQNAISLYIDQATIEGVKPSVIQTESDYTGAYATDPILPNYIYFAYQTLDNTVTEQPVGYDLKIEYYCELFDMATTQGG